jgi:hypothetical protein
VEVRVPPGLSARAAREQVQLMMDDGTWLDRRKKNTRLHLRSDAQGLIAVLEVHRLTPRFSVCCGFRPARPPKLRIRFRDGLTPSAVQLCFQNAELCRPFERKGKRLWVLRGNCSEGPGHLSIDLPSPDGPPSTATPPLRSLDHRVQVLGRRCPCRGGRGKAFLGLIPQRERERHRTYIVTRRTVGPSSPAR